MAGVERGIAEVFAALESWFVSTGATQSMMRLAWAVLTVLWLGYVAASTRPGRTPDLIDAFGRLVVAGGLLTAMGSLTRVIIIGFETFRGAGAAVLAGLVEQSWRQFVQGWLVPHLGAVFAVAGLWFAYPWAMAVLVVGLLLGVLLFAVGAMVYLAILFFAHLTLLLAILLAPLAIALLASPATQRWTARWVVVIVRTGLVVFTVRVIHAAVLYLAVIVPVREVAGGLQSGFPQAPPGGGPVALLGVLLNLAMFLVAMFVGTGIGIYAMLRAERLTGQFVEGVAFGEGIFGGPLWLRAQLAAWHAWHGGDSLEPNVATGGGGGESGPWGPSGSPEGGAQEATVIRSAGRLPR
jgi:TrbL/VirB6 plasmid conjugal transfer protein